MTSVLSCLQYNTISDLSGASPTAEAMAKAATTPAPASPPLNVVRPKQQLLYLAEVLGFPVQFTDFPKVNIR